MLLKKMIYLLGVALLLVACSNEPTLDTSTKANLESSFKAMKDALPPAKASELQEAVESIFSRSIMENAGKQDFQPQQEIADTYKRLHGKTAEQIIAMAERR